MIGEFSLPDMRTCVQYAVDYPDRFFGDFEELDLFKVGSLSFFPPDTQAFPLLSLSKRAFADGGAMPAVLNALDEIAVARFLHGEIDFVGISDLIEALYEKLIQGRSCTTLSDILAADAEARRFAKEY